MKATTKHTRSGHYSQAPQAKVARAAGPHDSHLARTAPARSQLSVTNAMATMQRMLVHTSESLERSIKMHAANYGAKRQQQLGATTGHYVL